MSKKKQRGRRAKKAKSKGPWLVPKKFWDKKGRRIEFSTRGNQKKAKLWLVTSSTMHARAAACCLWVELRVELGHSDAMVWIDGKGVQPSAREVLEGGGDPKDVGLVSEAEVKEKKKSAKAKQKTKDESRSVKDLLKALKKCMDKSESRKLRGLLRKAGHKGGLKG